MAFVSCEHDLRVAAEEVFPHVIKNARVADASLMKTSSKNSLYQNWLKYRTSGAIFVHALRWRRPVPASMHAAEKRPPDLTEDADDALRTARLGEDVGLPILEVQGQDAGVADVHQHEGHTLDQERSAEVVLVPDARLALILRDGGRRKEEPEELGRRLPRWSSAA